MLVTFFTRNLCRGVKQQLWTDSNGLKQTISRVCVGLVGWTPIRNELSGPSADLKMSLDVFRDMHIVHQKAYLQEISSEAHSGCWTFLQ